MVDRELVAALRRTLDRVPHTRTRPCNGPVKVIVASDREPSLVESLRAGKARAFGRKIDGPQQRGGFSKFMRVR